MRGTDWLQAWQRVIGLEGVKRRFRGGAEVLAGARLSCEFRVDWLIYFRCVLLDLLHPLADILKGLSIVDCIGHNDAHGAFIVGLRDCFESFLPSSIPYLQLYLFTFDFNCFYLEIYAFCSQKKKGIKINFSLFRIWNWDNKMSLG